MDQMLGDRDITRYQEPVLTNTLPRWVLLLTPVTAQSRHHPPQPHRHSWEVAPLRHQEAMQRKNDCILTDLKDALF